MFGTVSRVGTDNHAQFTDKRDAEKIVKSLRASAEWGENFDLESCVGGWRIAKSYREKSEGYY